MPTEPDAQMPDPRLPAPGPTGAGSLDDRYGRTGHVRRLVITVIVGVAAIVGLIWLGWAAYLNATPAVSGTLISFDVTSEHQVTATVTTHARTATGGSCFLEALASDHSLVGQLSIPVPGGSGERTFRYPIRTERAATTVQVLRCSGH